MAKPTPPKTSPPPELESELPTTELLGWVQLPRGWAVLRVQTQGDRVIDREVLHEPDTKGISLEKMRVAFVRLFMQGRRK